MHKMETKLQTKSVLAKLMGLERPQPSKLVRHGQQRVLSESYLQDIALICQQQKWSFDRFSMDADDRMFERRDSYEDLRSSSSSEEFLERYRIDEDKMFQKLWLLNSFQKADRGYYSSRGGSYLQKVKSPKKMENFSAMRRNGTCLGEGERDCLRSGNAPGHCSMATHGIAKQVANELQHSVWHDFLNGVGPVSTKEEIGSQNPHTTLKMKTGDSNIGQGQCISNSTSFPSSGSSNCRNKNFNVHKDWCLNLVNEGSSHCNSLQKVNCKSEEGLKPRKLTAITSLHSEKDVSCERDLLEEIPSVPVSPKEISTCSDVESLSSKNKECVTINATSQEVIDDAFMPLHQADNESPICQSETSKPNPDSASNMKDISSAAHFSSIHGSEVKLQQLTTTVFYPEAKKHKRMDVNDTEETQALSYLVDVLAESGLQCGNMETCYELGQPLENPINPFVFDSLEKKYSKQQSWLKSDRKLLFDRILCVRSNILHPNTGISTWCNYKTNRLLFHCNQELIKEELLAVLVNQEKEAKRVPSDKVVGIDVDWLELEEDTQIVVKEIEEILIDELVEEMVSTFSFM